MPGDCHAGSSLRSEFQLTAMTGKGDNDRERGQCVTNHMNEYEELTERPGMIYAFQRQEGIVAGRLGGSPKRPSTTERIQASYSVLI